MKHVWFIRHAESASNAGSKTSDSATIPITDLGQKQAEELANKGGCNKQTYSNFISKGTDIRLGTFIDILRGIGELENFQKLVEYKEPYSPLGNQTKPQKRVRKTNTPKEKQIEWND